MRWHCFTDAYESMHHAVVEADSPREAALKAAEELGYDGPWTVITGDAYKVTVHRAASYEAEAAEPLGGKPQ